MADLRLVGRQLAVVRALAENPVSRQALWQLVSRDFHVAELAERPARDRGRVEEVPCPRVGAPPRRWGESVAAPQPRRGSAAAWRAAFRQGRATPEDALAGVLDRSDFGDSTFSPFVALDDADRLREAARASSERYRDGNPRGPLDGIVIPIKDEFHMRGLPTRGGTSWRTEPVASDAFIVTRLRKAGALLPGKAHATENGMNPLGYNPHFDYPRNVYSAEHGAGGSSTGSAVAVGLGMAPVAVSTDGGGSIRLPAAMNGLFGLKPSLTRLSRTGDIWLGTVGHAGPIGRSTEDLVDLLEICAAPDPDDPFTLFASDWGTVKATWRAALTRSIAGCRIGVLVDELRDASPPIAKACNEALELLEREGAVLVDVHLPLLEMANAVGPIVIAGESAANASDDLARHRADFSDEVRLVYGLMQCVTAQEHLRALRTRTRLREALAETIAGVDVLALPTHARLAAPYPLAESRMQVSDTAWTASMTRFCFAANLTGVPAGSIPVGMHDGLPIGLQIVGDAFDEASVLAVSAALERCGVTNLPEPRSFATIA